MSEDNNNEPLMEERPPLEEAQEQEPTCMTITNTEYEQLKRDASEFKEKYLRLLAESENARKRLIRERQDMIQYAIQNIIIDFLHPLDYLENALKFQEQMTDEVRHWAKGFEMILGQFKNVLASQGVSPFESIDKHFDPHLHEAVEVVETEDYPPNTVIKETLRGYKMGDRTIRPARVVVAKPPKSTPSPLEEEANNI